MKIENKIKRYSNNIKSLKNSIAYHEECLRNVIYALDGDIYREAIKKDQKKLSLNVKKLSICFEYQRGGINHPLYHDALDRIFKCLT